MFSKFTYTFVIYTKVLRMRNLSMKKVREVLRLYIVAELSARAIKGATSVARTTVQDYIKRYKASGIDSFETLDAMNDELLRQKLFGELKILKQQSSKVMPNYNIIHQEMKKKRKTKVTLMLLWEEYKKEYDDNAYEYTQFRVYYKRYRNRLNPSMRQIHIAGEKVFVDYSGLTLPIHNQKTGEVDNAQVFVAVLGASGFTFVHVTPSQKQEDFILSHTLAYQFFEGTPQVVVPDNLKSAIISNNKKGIVVNDSYAELARHYSMLVEPARPFKPKDKAKAEQGVQGIQRYILACFRHTKFFSVDEANEAIVDLLDRYNNKVMKHLNKSRRDLYEEIEKQELRTLPSNRYIYEQFKVARVNQEYHIMLEKCNYSVPFKYIKEEVEVRYSSHHLRIYFQHELIATHPRLRIFGSYSTLDEHMPKEHDYINQKWNPSRMRSWAKNIGEYSTIFVEDAFSAVGHEATAYTRIQSILKLAKTYGNTEFELALMYAYGNRIQIRVKSLTSILDKRLYLQSSANNSSYTTPSLFNTHENIRGADEYK